MLVLALALAVTLIFLVLVVEFRSLAQPFAIVTGATLSLSGAFLALWITGKTVNVISLFGAIMVVGIVAKNGILLLDAVGHDSPPGATLAEALAEAGARRFRPVLMTTMAAVLGMLPLSLALGAGSEMLQPMATPWWAGCPCPCSSACSSPRRSICWLGVEGESEVELGRRLCPPKGASNDPPVAIAKLVPGCQGRSAGSALDRARARPATLASRKVGTAQRGRRSTQFL